MPQMVECTCTYFFSCNAYILYLHLYLSYPSNQCAWDIAFTDGDDKNTKMAIKYIQNLCRFLQELLAQSFHPLQDFEFVEKEILEATLEKALKNLEDLVYTIAPPIEIKSKYRGKVMYHPLGTRSCHYMFKHVLDNFKRDGQTAKKTAAMPEFKQGNRRRIELNSIFRGTNKKHVLNRHGKALKHMYLVDLFLLKSDYYINMQLKEQKKRRKKIQVERFLPSKKLALKTNRLINKCKRMKERCSS